MVIQRFTAGDAKLVDGSFKEGVKIGILAQMSEIVLEESSIVATFSSGGTATLVAGSIANEADFVQGNSDQLFGIYTVGSDDNASSLNVSSFEAATDGDDTIQTIDVYGNVMTSTAVPQSTNLANASAIIIDTIAPTATITGVAYNVDTGVITFTGTNFTTIAATSVEDITSYMDWTKVWWDIDGDNDSQQMGAEIGDDDFAFDGARITFQTRLLFLAQDDSYIDC